MTRPQALRLAAERARWADDARKEAERCATRHDDAGVAKAMEEAAAFELMAVWWRSNADTWDVAGQQKQIRELGEERRRT